MQSQLMGQAIWDYGNPAFPQLGFCFRKFLDAPAGTAPPPWYYWYFVDGSGINCFDNPDEEPSLGNVPSSSSDSGSTYHFPTTPISMDSMFGRADCMLYSTASVDNDRLYGEAAEGETVAYIECTSLPGDNVVTGSGGGPVVIVAICLKAYSDVTTTGDESSEYVEQLFQCNYNTPPS
jgi:hypothetical protein